MHNHVLAPKVKTDYKLSNHCNLTMRCCPNRYVDVHNNSIRNFSPIFMADSLRFSVGASACLNLIMSVTEIVNCFQNSIRSQNDPVYMHISP